MCGRYAITLPSAAMEAMFGIDRVVESFPRYNIAPTQPVIAILEDGGRRQAKLARWGLVPNWVKDPRDFPLLINARAETMAQKPAFRDCVRHGRCVLPASGYYEWQAVQGGGKQPYYITRADGGPVLLAGLHATWTGPNGEEVDTLATITVPANADLAPIHHRMPAILETGDIDSWLDVRGTRFEWLGAMIAPRPAGTMRAHPVSTRVNSAVHDDPGLIVPAEPILSAPEGGKPSKVKAKTSGQLDLF